MKINTKTLALIIPIALVLLVSGCTTSGGSSGPGTGVSIVSFQPDLSSISSGESLKLHAQIKNNGVATAENVKAVIAGIDPTEWQGDLSEKFFGQLKGFDIETSTEGSPATIVWPNLKAPQLGSGTLQTYRPQLRVTYDYKTTANLPITFVNRDELRRLRAEGKSLPTGSLTSSAGPLRVDIRTGQFVKTTTTGEGDNTFQVNIKVYNSGGGSVVPGTFTSGQDFDNPVRITLKEPAGTSITSFGGGQGCVSGDLVEGLRGQEWEISCLMEVTDPPASQVGRTMTVELDYTYLLTQETQVSVTGTSNPF